MTPLRTLIDAVKASTPTAQIDFSAVGDYDEITLAGKACENDTNAALQFVATMLPGQRLSMAQIANDEWMATIGTMDSVFHADLARALMICAFEAIEWQRAQKGGV